MTASLLFAAGNSRKLPVPDEAAQAKAMKLVKEIYGADDAKAEKPAAKQALARTLLTKARETQVTCLAGSSC